MGALPEEVFERELHQRLLSGDPVASQELAAAFLEPLVDRLRTKFQRLGDETLVLDAATDAVLGYAERPSQFNPDKLRLLPYLVMSARGDLLNALERRRRQAGREIPTDRVEDLLDARNSLRKEADPTDPGERVAVPDLQEVVGRVRETITDPVDRQLIDLMAQGERRTEPFAAVLGIAGLDVEQQRRIVKRHKDRLKKRLARLGVELREPS